MTKTTAEELARVIAESDRSYEYERTGKPPAQYMRLAQAILAPPVIAKIEADTRAKVIALVESGMYSEYGRPQPELVKAIRKLGEQP